MSNPLADQLYAALNRLDSLRDNQEDNLGRLRDLESRHCYRKDEAMENNNLIGRLVRRESGPLSGVIVAVWSHKLTLMVAIDVDGLLATWDAGEMPWRLVSDDSPTEQYKRALSS